MAVRLSALRSRPTLLSRNIIIFMFLCKPQGLVRPEGLGKFKKIASSGIEPATFRFVARYRVHSRDGVYIAFLELTYLSCRRWLSRGPVLRDDSSASPFFPFHSKAHFNIIFLYTPRHSEHPLCFGIVCQSFAYAFLCAPIVLRFQPISSFYVMIVLRKSRRKTNYGDISLNQAHIARAGQTFILYLADLFLCFIIFFVIYLCCVL
jgi:hypothetical protein